MSSRRMREQNRKSWNEATRAHNSHKADQAGFLRRGGSTLREDELDLLGDLEDKRLLHLLCNSGQDSLSLAQRGARVTGVDISDEAIAVAQRLSDESGISAEFVRSDVYDWLEGESVPLERFDLAFSSYGALPWIPDFPRLARGVHRVLASSGRWASIEFHPFSMTFDEQWRHRYPYGTGSRAQDWDEGVGDYVADSGETLAPSGFEPGVEDFRNPEACHEFYWGTGQVIQGLIDAGFIIERLVEYPYANGCRQGEGMTVLPGGRYGVPEGFPRLPLMVGWSARKS
jgi:SAM-dependent methyltransferase